jgi:hypothetical protein
LSKVNIDENILPTFAQFDANDGVIFSGYKIHPEWKYGL